MTQRVGQRVAQRVAESIAMRVHASLRIVSRQRLQLVLVVLGVVVFATVSNEGRAEVPVQSTVRMLPASNGHGALMLDLDARRLVHFREHLFAAEEPLLDAAAEEQWSGGQPLGVPTRDLLYDAYFGVRVDGDQGWLTDDVVDLEASGYAGFDSDAPGGTGIVTMVQQRGVLKLTTYAFAPRDYPHNGFVMALSVENTGSRNATDVSVFSLHNFLLGFGRPGVMSEIGEEGETVSYDGSTGHGDLLERGFAGVVVARALGPVAHHAGSHGAAPNGENIYAIVNAGGAADLPDLDGEAPVHDGSVSGFQFDLGDIAAGETGWVGVAFSHHGDPQAGTTVQGWLDAYTRGHDTESLVQAERSSWSAFQAGLTLPRALSGGDEALFRHSAAMLWMGQSRESEIYLREWLSTDGEARYTRFGTELDGSPATLPATVVHRGHGAVLASLPPGEWTVSWIRDGAYAVAAMAESGMHQEARAALAFYLRAEAGRFQDWTELSSYDMPPYQITLVRYYGFGVEETDFNDFGPNLEFDGFGLFLWALRRYEDRSTDATLRADNWELIASKIADPLVALVDPDTGLIRPDSSIWETHWNGRERSWTYTNITAVRGLCDAAALAAREGDDGRAESYRAAALALRAAIAEKLTDSSGALASNREELESGAGYYDAAVWDAVALGLFDPSGDIAAATLVGLDEALLVPAGAGWARNDDRFDHGATDLSPWGSEYDSGEWVITDLRGSVATWLMNDVERSDRLSNWVRDQALANYLEVAEVFDEGNGTYKFNSPMLGFGAGAFILARHARDAEPDPACGVYFDEGAGEGGGGATPAPPARASPH